MPSDLEQDLVCPRKLEYDQSRGRRIGDLEEALRSIGVDDSKAKSTAEKFDQALDARFQQELKTLATHEDIERLRAEMFEAMGKLRSEMIKWMFVLIFGQLWAIIGVLFAFFR